VVQVPGIIRAINERTVTRSIRKTFGGMMKDKEEDDLPTDEDMQDWIDSKLPPVEIERRKHDAEWESLEIPSFDQI
jgi:hypothetical protein